MKKVTSENKVIRGSIILLVMINIFNVLNYVFHFTMVRMLDAAQYGALAALVSLMYIFTIPSESIQTIISKYTSSEKDEGKLKNILKRALRRGIKISIILFAVYLVAAIILAKLLAIEYLLVAIMGLFIIKVFTLSVIRGTLQGKSRFVSLGWNLIVDSLFKVVIAAILVWIGLNTYGAVAGIILSSLCAFVLGVFSIKDILKTKEKVATTKEIYNYVTPISLATGAVILFYSLDVIMARVFLSPEMAGYYSIASIIAKIIFFGTLPISKVMFPMISNHGKDDKKTRTIYNKSLMILTACVISALALIALFPDFIVNVFSGEESKVSAQILIYISIAISLLAYSNLIILHKIATKKKINTKALLVFIALEIALFSIFNSSIIEYSIAFIVSSCAFLWGVVVLGD